MFNPKGVFFHLWFMMATVFTFITFGFIPATIMVALGALWSTMGPK